jgi:hypothetical protein
VAGATVATIVVLGLLAGSGDVGGDATSSPEPSAVPTVGEIPPGEFRPGVFRPVVSLQLDEGWTLARDSADTVQLESDLDGDLFTLGIHRPRGIASPDDEQPLLLPQDLTAWVEAHPALNVTERREEQLSGVTTVRFTAQSVYEANETTGASLAFLILEAGSVNLEPGIAYEIAILSVDGQPIIVIGSVPVRRAIELTERMDDLLHSIRFGWT